MGKHTNQVEPQKKRKKKGRPSLLDLQRRSLRLQQQQQNPNPSVSPNPYLRFQAAIASSSSSGLRHTRRNPNPGTDGDAAPDDDDDEEDDSTGRRREKKLRLVLRLPGRSANSASGSESDGGARKRKIDAVAADEDKTERQRQNSASKATDPSQDSGPTTPLPDKKLLVFILDRLQKKDTYGVFSEPVDPDELPDYHDIIEHPMDFGTIRKKLSDGAYVNLEQFEKDVFLISSNAMRYNAPDTIYYRQARSIQELAKKNFDNLRQESDDNEPEPKPKPVRRGRPPSNKTVKQSVTSPADHFGSDFSSGATLANAGDNNYFSNLANDLFRRGLVVDKSSMAALPGSAYGLHNAETHSWISGHRTERNEEFSGSGMKGPSTKYGKKNSVMDENRRNTYKQPQLSACVYEPPVLTALDGERKQLVPVGLHMEHVYARSLARFAATLGPIGWEIAAKQIQRAVPPGTRFGPGWIGESDVPHRSKPFLCTSPLSASQPKISSSPARVSTSEPSWNKLAITEGQVVINPPSQALASALPSRPTNSTDGPGPAAVVNHGSLGNGGGVIQPKNPFLLHQNPAIQPTANGFNTSMVFNLPSQSGKMIRPSRLPGSSSAETMNTNAGAFDTVSRSNSSCINLAPLNPSNADKAVVGNPSSLSNSSSHLLDSGQGSQRLWQGYLLNAKPGSVPPDLNVGFQSPGSPVSGVLVDSQQPDLALQL
ncbi:uncharacterized protein [Elaeis guineensis]|uniref:uncharacterized protein isoform X2 n=1 Tax=Elaeis guineensis var. tenera TaxID=51953 RepID=UPI003C6CF8A5